MHGILLPLILSFTITLLIMPVVILLARHKKLYDIPDGRKIHAVPTPSLGGLGLFAGIILTCLLTVSFPKSSELQYFVAAALVIFYFGLKDDLQAISPLKKFLGQSIAAILIIGKGGLLIKSMYGFMGVNDLGEIESILLTYFTIVVIVNSMNLIDGIDGLAGSLGLMIGAVLGFYFYKVGLTSYSILSFSMAGSLAAFLIFNFHPARIFMGDTGSLLIGLICSVLVIKFIEVAPENPVVPVAAAPAVGFSILMVPLLDTLRVFSSRILRGRSPFTAEKNHIHHILLEKKCSHSTITFLLVGANLGVIIITYLSRDAGTTLLILLITLFFFSGIYMMKYWKSKEVVLLKEKRESAGEIIHPTLIIAVNNDPILEEN